MLFDLNGFKHYNDTFGHLEGDRLLAQLARRLESAVCDRGSAYRLGGDEFCALVAGDPRELDSLLPELEAALGEAHDAGTVGCSYGVALIPHEAQTASEALALADRRMYERKDRDRRSTRLQMRDLLLAVVQEQRPDLHHHSTAVSALSRTVGLALGMTVNEVDVVVLAAELHDIGKVAIPDLVLGKPGPLDEDEWRLMRTHTIVGERLLCSVPTLEPVSGIVRSTHERWDGLGYPDGLAGEDIPLAARVVAACDAFDAMLSDRPYCPSLPLDEAVRELRGNAGSQFDPAVVEALVKVVTSSDAEVHRSRARTAPAEPRLSTIASLRGLLDVTRLVRRAGSLSSVLDAIARTVSESLGLGTVVDQPAPPGHRRVRRRHGARQRRGTRRAAQHGERLGGVGAAARRALPSARRVPHPCGRVRLDGARRASRRRRRRTGRRPVAVASRGRALRPVLRRPTARCSGSSRSASRAAAAVRPTRSSTCSSRWPSTQPPPSRPSKTRRSGPERLSRRESVRKRVLDRERIALRDERRVAERLHALRIDAAHVACDEHDRELRQDGAQTLRDLDAVHDRHRDVDDDCVGSQVTGERNCFLGAAGVRDHVEVERRVEKRGERAAVLRVVVDDQHGRHARSIAIAPDGMRNANRLDPRARTAAIHI